MAALTGLLRKPVDRRQDDIWQDYLRWKAQWLPHTESTERKGRS